MQHTKKLIFTIMLIFFGITIAEAKTTLFTCEYYKPYDELTGTQQAGILCNIYTDYSHQCYVEYGAASATTKSNKEKIKNWGSAIVLTWKAKEYVKKNNKCPDYLLAKLEKGIDGYELHAAETMQDALNLQKKLKTQRYIATNKNIELSNEEMDKIQKEIQGYIDAINGFMDSYSLESCMDNEKVITRIKECEEKVSAFKGILSNYETNVFNYINSNKLKETDDIVKKYRKAKEKIDDFLKNADTELQAEDKKIKEELGLETTPIETENSAMNITTNKMDCDGIFAGAFGNALKRVLSLIRFAVPVLIVALSTIDFIKAIGAQDNSEVKKATNKMTKRLIIGVIIFLLPTLLELILKLAGIQYGTCGIR